MLTSTAYSPSVFFPIKLNGCELQNVCLIIHTLIIYIFITLTSFKCRGDGRICGKVLVYKNPGKHWGDVHVFDAVWGERLNPYVGPSKYMIFFSTNGDRPVVDEIANSDLDGDLYWICDNAEVLNFLQFIIYSKHFFLIYFHYIVHLSL